MPAYQLRAIQSSCIVAMLYAYDLNILFTRIEFENCIIFAAKDYKSGVLTPRV